MGHICVIASTSRTQLLARFANFAGHPPSAGNPPNKALKQLKIDRSQSKRIEQSDKANQDKTLSA
jgi:hypothetical protein